MEQVTKAAANYMYMYMYIPGTKITAGLQPKSVHTARFAVYFTLRLVIMAGQEMCMHAIINLSPRVTNAESS